MHAEVESSTLSVSTKLPAVMLDVVLAGLTTAAGNHAADRAGWALDARPLLSGRGATMLPLSRSLPTLAPSYSGQVSCPLKAETWVQIPSGLPIWLNTTRSNQCRSVAGSSSDDYCLISSQVEVQLLAPLPWFSSEMASHQVYTLLFRVRISGEPPSSPVA